MTVGTARLPRGLAPLDRVTRAAHDDVVVLVSEEIVIERPLAEVQAQFGDVAYHERSGHHGGVQFRVLEDDGERCEYEQTTRVGPARLRQRFMLRRNNPAVQVNELIAGPLAPGSITFEHIAAADESTRVTATLRSEAGGLTRLAAPVLRRVLRRALAQALAEDRVDLESGTYAKSRAPGP